MKASIHAKPYFKHYTDIEGAPEQDSMQLTSLEAVYKYMESSRRSPVSKVIRQRAGRN